MIRVGLGVVYTRGLPFAAVTGVARRVLVLLLATAAALLATGTAGAFARQDVRVASTDGTALAATLTLPDGAPPTGGWPGLIYMHGLGGNRASSLATAQGMGVSEVADARIGGFGVSYGGGASWNSLAAGVPWAALTIWTSWTDLRQALVPQGLAKTGVLAGFLGSLDPKRVEPEVFALRDAAFAGNLESVGPFAAARSSLPALRGVRTPVFMMQGRRDFAFGLEHAFDAYRALAGPKQLWLGLGGHAPSSGTAADTPAVLAEGARWFDRFLRGDTARPLARPVAIAPERWRGQPRRFAGLPKVVVRRPDSFAVNTIPARRSIAQSGRYRIPLPPRSRAMEVFGAPLVEVRATATGGWSRIVGVLRARPPGGTQIVVGGGGMPPRAGTRTYRIALSSQATFLPRGSRLTLTLGSSSLAQSPANLLYLDLPFASTARLRVTGGSVRIPELATPISG